MSTLAFMTPEGADQLSARSPMERRARAAGARFESRDGWNVAVAFGEPAVEQQRLGQVGFADCSHMRKFELHGAALASLGLQPGSAERRDGAWWCPVTPSRVLVLGGANAPDVPDGVRVVDLTCGLAALTMVGPGCRELLARFSAIDVRPAISPVKSFRPGSIARTPGYLLVEDADRLLVLVGWALGEYLWEVVADAAEHLGGGPIGADALREPQHA